MTTEKEYRDNVLDNIERSIKVACERVHAESAGSPHKNSLLLVVANIGRMLDTLKNVKSDEAFIQVAKGIDEMLEKNFFSQIYGPRDFVPLSVEKPKAEKSAPKKESQFDVETHIVGNVDELPHPVRLKLAQALKAMGVPEQEINSQLKLGGQ